MIHARKTGVRSFDLSKLRIESWFESGVVGMFLF